MNTLWLTGGSKTREGGCGTAKMFYWCAARSAS